MISPAGIPNFLVESSSIAQSAVGVKGLGQAPKPGFPRWLSQVADNGSTMGIRPRIRP